MMPPVDDISIVKFEKRELSEVLFNQYLELSFADSAEESYPLPPISRERIRSGLKTPDPSYARFHRFYIEHETKMVGWGYWRETLEQSNINRSRFYIYIDPSYRKQSISKRLLQQFLGEMPAKIDTLTTGLTYWGETGYENRPWLHETLERMGGKLAYTEVINGTRLDVFDNQEIHQIANDLRTKAEENGYDIVFVKDGAYRELLEDKYETFVKLREELWNDMPNEDLTQEDEILTPEEHDEMLEKSLQRGDNIFAFVAVDRASKDPIALTEVYYAPLNPGRVTQDDTGVLKAHRGNRLGKTLKYLMLDFLLTSDLTKEAEFWLTGNASVNDHMRNINIELKHEPYFRWVEYEFNRTVLSEKLVASDR